MAGDAPDYIARLHAYACACQPCAAQPHEITASHPRTGGAASGGKRLGGKPGKGQRSQDTAAYPLCRKHHAQAQAYEFAKPNSYFDGWDRKRFAAWEAEQGAIHYGRYLAEQSEITAGTASEEVTRSFLRRKGFDPVEFAARWCNAKALGHQLAFDLGRDLRRELKEGGVPL
jgi:hypothetical protein